jgi:molecular chaperone DnaK
MGNINKADNSAVSIGSPNFDRLKSSLSITNKILHEKTERDMELIDVTQLALIYANDVEEEFYNLIEAGLPIPISRHNTIELKIQEDNFAYLNLYQGDIRWGNANKKITRVIIDGISGENRTSVIIVFTFTIDANGILSITGRENNKNAPVILKLQNFGGLSQYEINQLKKNANRSGI